MVASNTSNVRENFPGRRRLPVGAPRAKPWVRFEARETTVRERLSMFPLISPSIPPASRRRAQMLEKLSGFCVYLHRPHKTAVADNPNLVDDAVAARPSLRADDATGIPA